MTAKDITFDPENSGLVDPDSFLAKTKPKLTSSRQALENDQIKLLDPKKAKSKSANSNISLIVL